MSDLVFEVYYEWDERDDSLALFSRRQMAEDYAGLRGALVCERLILSEVPERVAFFHATYYSWHGPLGSEEEAWSNTPRYGEIVTAEPRLEHWNNGRGNWTITAYDRSRAEVERSLEAAVSSKLGHKWSWTEGSGRWL